MTRKKNALPGGAELDLEHRLSYRFAVLSTKVTRSVATMYGPRYGLLPSAWKTMAAIGRYGPVSAKEVCWHITVEPDKVTRAVDRLVDLGMVQRERDSADGRKVSLSLTPSGRRVFMDIERATRNFELALLDGLSMHERKTLSRILGKLEAKAEEYLGERRVSKNSLGPRPNASRNAK